jgi:DNA repair photolyase
MTQNNLNVKKSKNPTGTKEWADHNVNCISGCLHNCRYCYAKIMANRFGRNSGKNWQKMSVRSDAVNKNYGKYRGRIMFPTSHDIVNIPEIEEACFIVLEKLLQKKNDVLLTTKPNFKIIKKIDTNFSDFREFLQFRFTITSTDNDLLRFWEPNAPQYEERLQALKFAFNKNYKTSVSIEPFLDYNPRNLVEQISPYITESIWLGIMNYIPQKNISDDEISYYKSIRKNYSKQHLEEIVRELKLNPKIRWKDSIKTKLKMAL